MQLLSSSGTIARVTSADERVKIETCETRTGTTVEGAALLKAEVKDLHHTDLTFSPDCLDPTKPRRLTSSTQTLTSYSGFNRDISNQLKFETILSETRRASEEPPLEADLWKYHPRGRHLPIGAQQECQLANKSGWDTS